MAATWTTERVLALAPDASSVRAARGLATARPWSGTGAAGTVVWGLCSGTADEPYRTSVDVGEPAFGCTCPSPKYPCKHALGLLLLWVTGQVPEGCEVPAWAEPHQHEQGMLRERRPPDPEAQARRASARATRMTAGLEELDRWLRDLVRAGLASAESRPYSFWEDMAARLVDAQAPGAAAQVRRLGAAVRSGAGWENRALGVVARLWLLAAAWPRLALLPADLQAEVRAQAGWAVPVEEVLAGPTVRDRWQVLGRHTSLPFDEDRLAVQRTWLWGEARAQPALILEFALARNAFFRTDLATGTAFDAELAFYPGTGALRAVLVVQHSVAAPVVELHAGWSTVADALAAHAAALARNPWLDRWPLVLRDVVPAGGGVRDRDGAWLPLRDAGPGWPLLALSGGHPVAVTGEWEDGVLRPLAACAGGRMVPL